VSRVFVSSAHRDRAVGEHVAGMLRSLGDEPLDDRDEASGTAWWNEVVGRIEECDVFLAIVSPAYAEAHACRLAAKYAAAAGLPVVRLDLVDKPPTSGLHPGVLMAHPVRFQPDDPEARAVLDESLDLAFEQSHEAPAAAQPTPEQPEALLAAEPALPHDSPPPDPSSAPANEDRARFSGLELALAALLVVLAVALVVVEAPAIARLVGRIGDQASGTDSGKVRGVTTRADQASSPPSSAAPASPAGSPSASPETLALLATIGSVGSARLPAASCDAGADVVTCTNPAPNVHTVVLTPYASQSELYEAYQAALSDLSGDSVPENTGDCSAASSEGESGWNLDEQHTLDFTVEEQEVGGLNSASESAGRVFCTASQDVMRLVWTQDPGLLVTVTGQPAEVVVDWWEGVHLQLACADGSGGSGCSRLAGS
jgi:TIR domain